MESLTFVLFGATGDLARRKIFPALYNLYIEKKMPQSISIIGLGRNEMSDGRFQQYVKQAILDFSRRVTNSHFDIEEFLESFRYSKLDANKLDDYYSLLQKVQQREQELTIPENRVFYFSVAPVFFDAIAKNIKESGLGTTKGWKRIMIEKPFGHDLKSARELNEKLSSSFSEEEIYRIDHYLGKPMVQNLEALEFANPIFQSLWNNQYISNVQITASEKVGVEDRAGYYDHAGALRDMVQNHLLQMVMMTAMHLPKHINANNIRSEKRAVLESLRSIHGKSINENIILGQYVHGQLNNRHVLGYTEEANVSESSSTETFVAARLWIDNEFWKGVPFYIRTGKRMKEKSTRIVIEFKNPLKELYQEKQVELSPNLLIIEINPNEKISLQVNSKDPLNNGKMEAVKVHFAAEQKNVPEAYERLIFDAFRGDSTFFAHWKEVELSWEWIQPILEAVEQNKLPLYAYKPGSNGPEAALNLLEKDRNKWWLDKEDVEEANLICFA